jgi:hypothetical protein
MFEQHGFRVIAYEKTGTYIDAVMQLRIVYWDLHILSKVKHIPVLRTILRKGLFTMFNIGAILARSILPRRQDLYLNNVMLAEKA